MAKVPFSQNNLMILQRNVIVGVIILIRHAQKIRKTIGASAVL